MTGATNMTDTTDPRAGMVHVEVTPAPQAARPAAPQTTDERAAFEAWDQRMLSSTDRIRVDIGNLRSVKSAMAQIAWDAWQARAALSQAAPAQPAQPALHPRTADLVDRFAAALKEKLAAARPAAPQAMVAVPQTLWNRLTNGEVIDPAHLVEAVDLARAALSQAAPAQPAQTAKIEVRFEYERMTPVEGFDRIYEQYATTFGRFPDAFMAHVVAQTKEDLFMWWGRWREAIRAALVAAEDVAAGSTDAMRATVNAVVAQAQPAQPEQPEKLHAYACHKAVHGETKCDRWCGYQDRCLSTLTYSEDYMQAAYERGRREVMAAAPQAQPAQQPDPRDEALRMAREALVNSRDLIATDRQAFVDCQRLHDTRTDDPIAHGLVAVEDGVWLDANDAEALRDYDRGIEQIDAAIARIDALTGAQHG